MEKLRKLQYFNRQFYLNIPVGLARNLKWNRGDYLNVIKKDENIIEIKKIAEAYMTKEQVFLPKIESDARKSYFILSEYGNEMDSPTFSHNVAKLMHLISRMRKYKMKNPGPLTRQTVPR